ncbi:MAG: hypothetical protein ABSB39_18570 [Candidatus Sulfotelmatobacter sp.]|jgi:hypothetical protein
MNRAILYVDSALAWIIFAIGIVGILTTVTFHMPFRSLDTPLLWLFVAMFNLLRVRNGRSAKTLITFCIGANLAVVMLEAVRFKMWGPFALFAALPILCELVFSVRTAITES